jgi:WhiB family redox-sensing transcriptional regulator
VALTWQELNLTDDEPWPNEDPAEIVGALADLLKRPAWHAQAGCRGQGPQQWFPGRGEDVRPGQAVCRTCPVQADCLAEGLTQPSWGDAGIWGGSTARVRRQLRRVSTDVDSDAA